MNYHITNTLYKFRATKKHEETREGITRSPSRQLLPDKPLMMTMNIPVIFVALFSCWNAAVFTDANMGETLEMRIYDRDSKMSDNQMRAMLDKAALEEHGFKLEIISKLAREPESESDKPVYQKAYYYYKTVDCLQVPEVNEELDSLIPGVLGSVILTKVRAEIKTRNLDHLKKCQTGLEVHFKEAEGCYGSKKSRVARRTKRGCSWCMWCSSTKVLIGN